MSCELQRARGGPHETSMVDKLGERESSHRRVQEGTRHTDREAWEEMGAAVLFITEERMLNASLINKFSKPCELVYDLSSGTFLTAKAYLQLLLHYSFVGCRAAVECSVARTEKLAETYTR